VPRPSAFLGRRSAGQSTVEHLALGLAVAAVVAGLATAVVHDVPGLVVGALRDALGRRPPPLRDDSWALGSSTYRPLIRRYAPRLVLERDVWGHDDAVPVDPRRCRHAACARFGEATPTAFVHLKRLPTATYIAYWTYYPGSQTSHLPLAALRGAHRDDWEGLIVRLDASGAWARRLRTAASRARDRGGPSPPAGARSGRIRRSTGPPDRTRAASRPAGSIWPATTGTARSA
jgi:hypothetical protein